MIIVAAKFRKFKFKFKSQRTHTIHSLLRNPVIFNPIRKPRNPIVLCHGLYGFDVWTPPGIPKLQLHYWADLMDILRNKIGAEVIVTGVPGTGSVKERAEAMDLQLKNSVRGKEINFLAHSMGGLDCRHLLTHIRPNEYKPRSLTTISTPHRGSPFMDWCAANIGIGAQAIQDTADASSQPLSVPSMPLSLKSPLLQAQPKTHTADITNNPNQKDSENQSKLSMPSLPAISLPLAFTSSLSSYLLALLDSPAYANLTTAFTNGIFNPRTPDVDNIKYYSIAARHPGLGWWHPLFLPQLVLEASAKASMREAEGKVGSEYEGNDGLVSVSSAKWGEFLGVIDGVDHWWMRGSRGFPKEKKSTTVTDATTNTKQNIYSTPESNWQDVNKQIESNWRGENVESYPGTSSTSGTSNESDPSASSSVSSIAKWFSDRIPNTSQENQSGHKADEGGLDKGMDREQFYIALCHKLYQDGL
ncbi:hypothetical protein E3P92_03870 [Wallemia ichthyophaga]|uniref:DUF676 domain-containing protein n=2 Tax=Wallemia ichthyophaga TaxID=245174 RepID=A0A4T0G2S2_WALIC|nr:Lipase 2 [Wallemia ichthyophaga EXF-994]TIA68771.1 hypothetical protein E3P91_03923 [Wallemia ichthyophaga]EOQ99319.1 Lipase 2 [Wallemia ichthyophaga EXF-994]TIA78342.1 hypothetical protein E3P98_03885 [Wallemia ichthyophaga]TIA95065.1 hypothetical protein E3P95_03909 [Wallemia ichthyophaga]TIA95891.1 hypothetical protein E3P94_03905 [Wallemia ichthyophaga]